MGSAKQSTAAPPSSQEKAPDSKYGARRSSKAKRYTFDDDDEVPTQSEEPAIPTGEKASQKPKGKPDYDDLLNLLSTNAKAKQNAKVGLPSFDLPEFDIKTVQQKRGGESVGSTAPDSRVKRPGMGIGGR